MTQDEANKYINESRLKYVKRKYDVEDIESIFSLTFLSKNPYGLNYRTLTFHNEEQPLISLVQELQANLG